MNLFLIAWSPSAIAEAEQARQVLAELGSELPFFGPGKPAIWRAPSGRVSLATLQHAPEELGGIHYTRTTERAMAFFAGRPILWTTDREADGRAPLDPALYLAPAERWIDRLDGRWAVAVYDETDGALRLHTDALGSYAVYETVVRDVRWISNSPEALRRVAGISAFDDLALACALSGGWSLDGTPIWSGIERLPAAIDRSYLPSGEVVDHSRLPLERIVSLPGRGFDAEDAACALVAAVRALADWPGRTSDVSITGGRDARVILAAALHGGLDFTATTGGYADRPDARRGRELCRIAGVAHEELREIAYWTMVSQPALMARRLMLMSGGTVSLANAAGLPVERGGGAPDLWHTGQGGEIARRYFQSLDGPSPAGLARALKFTGGGVIAGDVERLLERHIGSCVEQLLDAGATPADVPDLFYLVRRMAHWGAPGHGCVEYARDATSPLWSVRLLPQMLGASREQRRRERFHTEVLRRLAPELASVPLADGRPWQPPSRAKRVWRRLLRHGTVPSAAQGDDAHASETLQAVNRAIVEAAMEQADHPAWRVLDAAAVHALFDRSHNGLNGADQAQMWRLGTVFLTSA